MAIAVILAMLMWWAWARLRADLVGARYRLGREAVAFGLFSMVNCWDAMLVAVSLIFQLDQYPVLFSTFHGGFLHQKIWALFLVSCLLVLPELVAVFRTQKNRPAVGRAVGLSNLDQD
ncbi:MAG: hypothetical protein Alpg2KO_27820 [Alphaproteobacteria bacterium]